jgi:hypothetical protein
MQSRPQVKLTPQQEKAIAMLRALPKAQRDHAVAGVKKLLAASKANRASKG